MIQLIKHFLRIVKIIYILAKHDGLSILRKLKIAPITSFIFSIISLKKSNLREGERIARALEELGPIYIKIGQTLSTRTDLLGEEISKDLSRLRDKLPPFSFQIAKSIIESEFQNSLDKIFMEFNEVTIAAASVAQVHKAKTMNGEIVAVKILRPNIEKAFKRDIELFYYIAKLIERNFKNSKRFRASEIVKNFENGIKNELDLRFEGSSGSELKENCKNDDEVYIPKIYWALTTSKILTTEWVDAISIYNIDHLLKKNFNLNILASKLSLVFFKQAFRDGFFHADLHPGNILVRDDGKIILVDFGIVGRLDKQLKIYVAEILYGFLKKDYHYVAKAHFNAGLIEKNKSIEAFAASCRAIGETIVGMPVEKISIAHLLAQLFKVAETFEMQIEPKLISLQKTMMLVEGIGYKLNPKINMWKLVEPWIEDWMIENIGIEAKIKNKIIDIINYFVK